MFIRVRCGLGFVLGVCRNIMIPSTAAERRITASCLLLTKGLTFSGRPCGLLLLLIG